MGTRHLRGRWVTWVTLGELAGFLVPAAVAGGTADRGGVVLTPVLVAAGAVEGAVLGWSQAVALGPAVQVRRRWSPARPSPPWAA